MVLWMMGKIVKVVLKCPPTFHRQIRFYVLYIKPSRIHQRKFDASGKEIEPNFSDTKKVNTGFLMSSYSESITTDILAIVSFVHSSVKKESIEGGFFFLEDLFKINVATHVRSVHVPAKSPQTVRLCHTSDGTNVPCITSCIVCMYVLPQHTPTTLLFASPFCCGKPISAVVLMTQCGNVSTDTGLKK